MARCWMCLINRHADGIAHVGQLASSAAGRCAQHEMRQGAVDELMRDERLRSPARDALSDFTIWTLAIACVYGRASPRDLKQVQQTLAQLPHIKHYLAKLRSSLLTHIEDCVASM